MANLYKALTVLNNLANYAVGIAVCAILIFKRDFISIFFFNGMTTNMALFFNMIMFQLGVVLLAIVLSMLVIDNKKPIVVTFPVIYMIVPVIVGVIGIYFGITGVSVLEKVFVIAASVIYVGLSGVLIYFSTKLFEAFSQTVKTK